MAVRMSGPVPPKPLTNDVPFSLLSTNDILHACGFDFKSFSSQVAIRAQQVESPKPSFWSSKIKFFSKTKEAKEAKKAKEAKEEEKDAQRSDYLIPWKEVTKMNVDFNEIDSHGIELTLKNGEKYYGQSMLPERRRDCEDMLLAAMLKVMRNDLNKELNQ